MTQEVLKLALEALSVLKPDNWVDKELQGRAWDAVKKALAQPEQEPVANIRIWHKNGEQHAELWNWDKGIEALPDGDYDLYTTPPQPEQEPVAWQDTAKPSELVAAEDWENIDPQWHWMYRPLYTTPPQPEQEPVAYTGNGTAGREADVRPTGFFFQMPKTEQEPVAIVHIKDDCLVGSHRDNSKPFPDGQYGLWPIGTTPPQRKPLPPQSPCEMTQAEGKMFKLGWLECEAAHGIKGEA